MACWCPWRRFLIAGAANSITPNREDVYSRVCSTVLVYLDAAVLIDFAIMFLLALFYFIVPHLLPESHLGMSMNVPLLKNQCDCSLMNVITLV